VLGNKNYSQFIILYFCDSFFLTLFPCSSVGCLLQETVQQELLQSESLLRATDLNELFQHGSFPWGAVLQEQAAPAWVPCGVTSPASKPAPVWASVSLLGHRSWQEPAPARELHDVTASFEHPAASAWGASWAEGGYLLHCGPPWAAGTQPASPQSAPRAAGESLLQHLKHLLPLLLH